MQYANLWLTKSELDWVTKGCSEPVMNIQEVIATMNRTSVEIEYQELHDNVIMWTKV